MTGTDCQNRNRKDRRGIAHGIGLTAILLALALPEPSLAKPKENLPKLPTGPAFQQGGIAISVSDSTVQLVTGRTTTLVFDGNVTAIRILKEPEHGRVTVNPDQSLAVVMTGTDHVGQVSFISEVSLTDGATKAVTTTLDLIRSGQAAGWGPGQFYLLATDDQDRTIVEPGSNHRKIHVSGRQGALSRQQIASRAGLPVKQVDGGWLAQRPEYGGTEGMALDEEAGLILWKEISRQQPASVWLLFERGYRYGERIDLTGVNGESPLHPVLISSYGDTGKAVIGGGIRGTKTNISNIVIQDLELTGEMNILWGKNILVEDVLARNALNLQNMEGLTVRDSASIDVYRRSSGKVDGVWNQSRDRISGIFVKKTNGLLIENNLFDHAGWSEGYDYNLSEGQPQPPSFYSHNVYIQKDNTDVTFRDNISMRGASFGAQVRPGGFIEDNVFIDNNAGVNFFGGEEDETGILSANYTLFTGNLITSGAHKEVAQKQGALTMGVDYGGYLPSLTRNIITHLADPANPEEQEDRHFAHGALKGSGAYYDDSIVHNWISQKDRITANPPKNPDRNTDDLDPARMDQTTIQNFTAQLLGRDSASIADLATALKAQVSERLSQPVDADRILAYFRTGFGLTATRDLSAPAQRFVPNQLGDGIRWDNRLNWDQGYLPVAGQDVDLGGNRVLYAGAGTLAINDLTLGAGGSLNTGAGKLSVNGKLSADDQGSSIEIGNAGQVWTQAYADPVPLSVKVTGGRFANTGSVTGRIDLALTGGQVLLAAGAGSFDLGEGSRIAIKGRSGQIGFDGRDGEIGSLLISEDAMLSFTTDEGGVSPISEFRSGIYVDTPSNSQSRITLGGTLSVDLAPLALGVTDLTLIAADEMLGDFDQVEITGLGNGRNATLLVDYLDGTVTLSLGAGTGQIIRKTRGEDTVRHEGELRPGQAQDG